jgi:DNA-binding transcriptional MerR regulator
MSEGDYSIQELSDQTGLPRRTIHFYIQQGLLPPPHGAGLGARYSETHLLRLRLIPLLRQRGLRLDEIRQQLQAMEVPELRQSVARASQPPTPALAPAPSGRIYTHYTLPAGLILIAPAALAQGDRQKLSKLLEAAGRIWSSTSKPPDPEGLKDL